MSEAVLDASALIALLHREPGGEMVAAVLDNAVMSSVNLTEVITKMIDKGVPPDQARQVTLASNVVTVAFDEELAITAGLMRDPTRSRGLSLGDRACLALAQRMNVPALTADRNWLAVDVGVDVRLIRD